MTTRSDYRHLVPIQTRWNDNDVYGHVNNVVYYAYFDTIINAVLIEEGKLDIHAGESIGLCVESQCKYLAPAAYPDRLEGGLRITKLGRSSIVYELGIFKEGHAEPVAEGRFVHVFVDRKTRRPTDLPPTVRTALTPLLATA
jgi:acyl-CoA thioester hydrolase